MLKFASSLGLLTRPLRCNKICKVNKRNIFASERVLGGGGVHNMTLVPTWLLVPLTPGSVLAQKVARSGCAYCLV
jgi:hypothetical protein